MRYIRGASCVYGIRLTLDVFDFLIERHGEFKGTLATYCGREEDFKKCALVAGDLSPLRGRDRWNRKVKYPAAWAYDWGLYQKWIVPVDTITLEKYIAFMVPRKVIFPYARIPLL